MDTVKNSKSITFSAIGDVLLHGRVYGGINNKTGCDFDNQLKNISGLLGKTDITMANLESIIAGNKLPLSSFPRFNAPVEIGYSLKKLGVDIVTLANNHVMDKGEEGLLHSINNLEEIGLEYDGAYKSKEDSERVRVIERKGLKIAFISYTRGINGMEVPEGKSYLVNLLKNTTRLKLGGRIRAIKNKKIADVVIVNLHFGSEYHLEPSTYQQELTRSLADAGADVILGHHPHVLQPIEWINTSRGTKSLVAYSLGNFFSGQVGLYRQIGGAISFIITKPHEDFQGIEISDVKFDLSYVQHEEGLKVNIHLLKEWVRNNKYIETTEGQFDSERVYREIKSHLSSRIVDLEIE